jgi:hypothetical protein
MTSAPANMPGMYLVDIGAGLCAGFMGYANRL